MIIYILQINIFYLIRNINKLIINYTEFITISIYIYLQIFIRIIPGFDYDYDGFKIVKITLTTSRIVLSWEWILKRKKNTLIHKC